jgi:predicted glycosyl hydrolase (DUF1957 family)
MAAVGKLAIVLDACRPFGRRAGPPGDGDGDAALRDLIEWTLPLVDRLRALSSEGVPFRLTLGLPPAAAARWRDPRFARRALEHLASVPTPVGPRLSAAWEAVGKDLVGALADLEAAGRVEILGGTATDAPLPLLASGPRSVRAQVAIGCAEHQRLFGRRPRGLWLPSGAWAPDLDEVLADEGVGFVVLEERGLEGAVPRPLAGVRAPIVTPPGGGVRPAGAESSRARAARGADPAAAADGAALRFVQGLAARGKGLDRPPLFVVAPDLAEAKESPLADLADLVERLLRAAAAAAGDLALVTLGGLLEARARVQRSVPVASARPAEGAAGAWVDGAFAWTLRHVHRASREMTALARERPDARGLERRALTQAARELLLLEGSAGSLLAHASGSKGAAEERLRVHLHRFLRLAETIRTGSIDEGWLRDVEGRDDSFEALDYRVYC